MGVENRRLPSAGADIGDKWSLFFSCVGLGAGGGEGGLQREGVYLGQRVISEAVG